MCSDLECQSLSIPRTGRVIIIITDSLFNYQLHNLVINNVYYESHDVFLSPFVENDEYYKYLNLVRINVGRLGDKWTLLRKTPFKTFEEGDIWHSTFPICKKMSMNHNKSWPSIFPPSDPPEPKKPDEDEIKRSFDRQVYTLFIMGGCFGCSLLSYCAYFFIPLNGQLCLGKIYNILAAVALVLAAFWNLELIILFNDFYQGHSSFNFTYWQGK